MTAQAQGNGVVRTLIWSAAAVAIGWGILAMVPGAVDLGAISRIQPHFDLAPALAAPPLVQVHLATVMVALVVGPIQFVMPKATPGHRMLGWVWALSMLTTAVVSFWIRDINDGAFSPIHLFSVWALISVPLGVWYARKGNVRAHRATMIGLYIGLVVAGILSIAPGRLTWDMFFG